MARTLSACLFLLFTFMSYNITAGQELIANECIGCHEDTYMKAMSNAYLHSVVKDKCPMCHIIDTSAVKNIKQMQFSIVQEENIVFLGDLPDDKKYILEATAMDYSGRTGAPVIMDVLPDDTWKFRGRRSSIKKISGVKVDEVKKAAFVKAVVTWDTDAYATSGIEYTVSGKYPTRVNEDDIYTKKHKVALNTLKHKKDYRFRVISADMNGNLLKSDEHGLDTSKGINNSKMTISMEHPVPNINFIRIFKAEGKKGFYMSVSTNKPSELLIKIMEEIEKKDSEHGVGLASERYTKMEVCYKCHPHDSSHPVGVKAEGPTLVTPRDLPTIEDGIITCVTCHKPHGGERIFYNRFDYKKDICIKCHIKGGAYIPPELAFKENIRSGG